MDFYGIDLMSLSRPVLYIYLVIVNIVAFIMYGVDKKYAIEDEWRIPEKTLIGVAAIGGSLGAFVGMRFFHHKTKKPLFKYLIPVILVMQIALLLVGE